MKLYNLKIHILNRYCIVLQLKQDFTKLCFCYIAKVPFNTILAVQW